MVKHAAVYACVASNTAVAQLRVSAGGSLAKGATDAQPLEELRHDCVAPKHAAFLAPVGHQFQLLVRKVCVESMSVSSSFSVAAGSSLFSNPPNYMRSFANQRLSVPVMISGHDFSFLQTVFQCHFSACVAQWSARPGQVASRNSPCEAMQTVLSKMGSPHLHHNGRINVKIVSPIVTVVDSDDDHGDKSLKTTCCLVDSAIRILHERSACAEESALSTPIDGRDQALLSEFCRNESRVKAFLTQPQWLQAICQLEQLRIDLLEDELRMLISTLKCIIEETAATTERQLVLTVFKRNCNHMLTTAKTWRIQRSMENMLLSIESSAKATEQDRLMHSGTEKRKGGLTCKQSWPTSPLQMLLHTTFS
jgi:hypothetical protein